MNPDRRATVDSEPAEDQRTERSVKSQDWDEVSEEVDKGGASAQQELQNIDEIETVENEDADDNDDNPYQESDAALPDDAEEAAIRRDPSREGSQFDEI